MSDFQTIRGFEEAWRPPVRSRRVTPQALLGAAPTGDGVRARLARLVDRVPEVMVKVTGRTKDAGHLRAHFDYISRNGAVDIEARDGALVVGRADVRALASDWAFEQRADPLTRVAAPFSHCLVLSMPAGTDPIALRDAVRAFATDMFAGEHDYVFALHTDTPRPHVHLSVCSRGDMGQRLNPKKADLERWRQVFAEKLRERGVQAEATPRRARGVTRKAERTPVRKIRERHEAGRGDVAKVRRSAFHEAARAAFQGDMAQRPWERQLAQRQGVIRALYLGQAKLLQRSGDEQDRRLGQRVEAFVQSMSAPDSQRLALARALRAAGVREANISTGQDRQRQR